MDDIKLKSLKPKIKLRELKALRLSDPFKQKTTTKRDDDSDCSSTEQESKNNSGVN
jgi:hypothetical protein